ncbi:rare lipoprotein A (RlpA)-like double-psi beta-barrel domain-containing protein [Rhizoctonia solani AG-1 IA]|uniref:Rare lipoprotein A (RlpA)-like double-psi beta-barrel domain-containing protein n=1 Tax=Thanatephorus cucumeris (strain AG1-IA) TaxID=983506 RepID=L8WNF7_THACA|nr:rare lipoprotein A (RlpA)-like double-psi beta-barrel domain-containing protein [Rhizoctonia solani AG-1 IA]
MRIVPAEPKFEWDPDCASSLSTINAEGVQSTESYHPLPPSFPFHKVRTTATMYSRTLTILTLFSLVIITLASPVPVRLAEAKVQTPAGDLEVRGTIEARANSGKGTWYNPSVGTGACGWNNKDSELVVALGPSKYNKAKKCGQSGSKSVKVKVVDLCPSCGGGSLEVSTAEQGCYSGQLGEEKRTAVRIFWTDVAPYVCSDCDKFNIWMGGSLMNRLITAGRIAPCA